VLLAPAARAELERMARAQALDHRPVRRAAMVLALADDPSPSAAARRVGVSEKTVGKWRERYLAEGAAGLRDRRRPGRPLVYLGPERCAVLGLACGKPADVGVECRNIWTLDALADAARDTGFTTGRPSRSTVFRILDGADIKPHRTRIWLHSPDPLFRERVAEICALYQERPAGSVVLCMDEKTEMQALGRPHPVREAAPGRRRRVDHDYIRNGTRKLLAVYNPHTAEVFGQMRATRTAADTVEFMEAVAARHPAGDVHIVWDNLNTHKDGREARWTEFNARHGGRFHFHYTPVHGSWMNQVELFFGILQRRVLKGAVLNSTDELDAAVLAFLDLWNRKVGKPFRWTFTGYPLQIGDSAA
jgi:transposase